MTDVQELVKSSDTRLISKQMSVVIRVETLSPELTKLKVYLRTSTKTSTVVVNYSSEDIRIRRGT